MPRKPRELRPIMTRLPDALCVRLEREANQAGRSMNSEIVERLENSFRSTRVGLLYAIVSAALSAEAPKWVTPDHGRETGFSAEVKATMKRRIAAFIDSLPDAPSDFLTEAEIAEIEEMRRRHRSFMATAGKPKR